MFLVVWLMLLVIFVVTAGACWSTRSASAGSPTGMRFVYYIPGALAGASSVMLLAVRARPDRQPGLVRCCTGIGHRDTFVGAVQVEPAAASSSR